MYADEVDMLIMEGGMLGKRHKDTDRLLPIMNFNFNIQHFVGDRQMGNFFHIRTKVGGGGLSI